MMYIEDLIVDLVSGVNVAPFFSYGDRSILTSFANSIEQTIPLTEKQANLALRILGSHRSAIGEKYNSVDRLIDNPVWRYSFRKLPNAKKCVIDNNFILIIFPYNDTIVSRFSNRNQRVNVIHRGVWNSEKKCWQYPITEKNIIWLMSILKDQNFEFCEKFIKLHEKIENVISELDQHIPTLSHDGERYILLNTSAIIPQPDTNCPQAALFHAKRHGITTWNDDISESVSRINQYTMSIVTERSCWIDSGIVSIDDAFHDIVDYGGPIVIIVPGGSEYNLIKQWTKFAVSRGIQTTQISTMFRLPGKNSKFNQYVKDAGLNNPVNDSTRIIFINTQVPKPLIKSGIKINTVIHLGYYDSMHYTMKVMLETVPNLVYYSMKKPRDNKWLPPEL
jgi:hypothetical protein